MEESKSKNIEKELGIEKLEKEDLVKYQLFEEIKKEFNSKVEIKIPFKEGKAIKIGNDFIYELANHQRIFFLKNQGFFPFQTKEKVSKLSSILFMIKHHLKMLYKKPQSKMES